MTSTAEHAHSRFGPSASEIWLNCTAAIRATEGMADRPSTFAAEGTAAHLVSEWAREQGKPVKAFLGEKIECDGFTFEVTSDWVEPIQRFVDFCNEIDAIEALVEERVHYTAWVEDGWGTADDIRITEDGTCYVTDLKFGKGVQKWAKDNPQLKLYALGVFQDFGHLYEIEQFVLTIHQPRLHHVDSWTISTLDLLKWAKEVAAPAAVIARTGEGAEFLAGDHCKFCLIRDSCTTRKAFVDELYTRYKEEDLSELPNYELAKVLDRASQMKAYISDMDSWIKRVEARALSELGKGMPVGDWKVVAGRRSRQWGNEKEAEEALRGVKKLKVKDIFEPPKLLTPAKMEKLIGSDHPIMQEHCKWSQGKPVLAPGDDPREALRVDPEEEFDDLDEAEG